MFEYGQKMVMEQLLKGKGGVSGQSSSEEPAVAEVD